MASVRQRKGSKFWWACITLPDKRRKQFSTGLEDEKEAHAAAIAAERAFNKLHENPHQLRAALDRLAEDYVPPGDADPAKWILAWALARKNECEVSTWETYSNTAKEAAAWFVENRITSFTQVTTEKLTLLRDHWRLSNAAITTNRKIKHLRIAFKVAVSRKLLPTNPATDVVKLVETATKRRDYRPHELDILIPSLTGEWRAAFLMGLNTGGQRLNDIAVLKQSQVDVATRTVTFFAKKTGKLVSLPLLQITIDALNDLPSTDNADAPVFPQIAALANSTRSNQFRAILAKVGLAPKVPRRKDRVKKPFRDTNELSFHSVRHTATSMLKQAGVSDGTVRAIVGHESVAMSKVYTHFDMETMRAALEKLPIG